MAEYIHNNSSESNNSIESNSSEFSDTSKLDDIRISNKPLESNNENDKQEEEILESIEEDDILESIKEDDEYNITNIAYDMEEEQYIEKLQNEYHINKSNGDWYYAKMIVSHAYQDKNNTELFCDILEKQFLANNDSFDNIITVYYKNNLDIDIVYQFSKEPAKHLVDNLRIPAYKTKSIIFLTSEDTNKWSFKIVVITTKGIYTANRYITEDIIGLF